MSSKKGVRGLHRIFDHNRESRADSGGTFHLHEADTDVFLKDKLLDGWKESGLLLNIDLGSRAMLFVCVAVLGGVTYTNIQRYPRYMKGDDISYHYHIVASVLEYIFLFISFFTFLSMLRTPKKYVYFFLVFCWYVYLLVIAIPPFNHACDDIFKVMLIHREHGRQITKQAYSLDCTSQGLTTMQIYMSWLMITPQVIPGHKMMNFNWFWIFIMFFGATYWYRQISGDKFYKFGDICLTLFLLSITNSIAISKKFYLMKSQRSKYLSDRKQKEASEKMFRVLEYMVPVHVIVRMLKNPGKVIADEIQKCSILFIMIAEFDQIARRKTPEELLSFLNDVFKKFDGICLREEVTKIETVGEEYVCAVGVVPDESGLSTIAHGPSLSRLVSVASMILDSQSEEAHFRMGIHTGPVVAGVIGQKLPRFRLFGDTINTAARMMQKGLDGHLQFGVETKEELPSEIPVKCRGTIEMKGKGQVTAYLLDRDPSSSTRTAAHSSDTENSIGLDVLRVSNRLAVDNAMMHRLSCRSKVSFASEMENVSPDGTTSFVRTSVSSRRSILDVALEATSENFGNIDDAVSALVADVEGVGGAAKQAEANEEATLLKKRHSLPNPKDGHAQSLSKRASALRTSKTTTLESPPRSALKGGRSRTSRVPSDMSQRNSVTHRSSIMTGSRKSTADTEAAWELKFQETLKEVGKLDGNNDQAFNSRCFCSPALGQDFSPEMETKWLQWFHDTVICKKLSERLDRQELLFAGATMIDTLWLVLGDPLSERRLGQEYESYRRSLRLWVFLFCRAASFGMIFFWRHMATCSPDGCKKTGTKDVYCMRCEWIHKKPGKKQTFLLLSSLFIAATTFYSYDALVYTSPVFAYGEEPDTIEGLRSAFLAHFRNSCQAYLLVAVPFFFLITTQHQLRFQPSLCFVALTFVLILPEIVIPNYSLNFVFNPVSRIVFFLSSVANAYFAYSAEKNSRDRYRATCALKDTHERIEKILNTLMPPMVVEEIRELSASAALPCHKYACATIAQSDLVGFTKLASTRKPHEVVEFVSELFGRFDELTDKHGIYKVETIGDAYIAGQADPPLTTKNKPCDVLLFGLGMVEQTLAWSKERELGVTCRVGIHTGECIGGIIGHDMQRYHLFGELMTCLEVLESTAPEGKVQVSPACKEAAVMQIRLDGLPAEYIQFERRSEEQLLTSKGEKHTFDEVGGRTFVVKGGMNVRECYRYGLESIETPAGSHQTTW